MLAHSPVVCEGRPDYSNTAYYTTPSGAGVFARGPAREFHQAAQDNLSTRA